MVRRTGPQNLRVDLMAYPLLEPGYYKDRHFGIRIESIVIVRSVETPNNFGEKGYLGFEHVTMVRILRKFDPSKRLAENLLSIVSYPDEARRAGTPFAGGDRVVKCLPQGGPC